MWAATTPDELSPVVRERATTAPFGVIAASLPYQLPVQLTDFLERRRPSEYFARRGRGERASPEVFSAGPGFLLSAGGVAFRPLVFTQEVARPITLFLDDSAADLRGCFQLPGKARSMADWNSTGVAHRFACANAPVRVPPQVTPVATLGHWTAFRPLAGKDLLLVVYAADGLGLLAIFPEPGLSPDALLHLVAQANGDNAVQRQFTFPHSGRVLKYDVTSPVPTGARGSAWG